VRLRTTDGVDLAVHDLGGTGPALVLAHATGFHGQMWGPLAGSLASRFHCWSFDARGHGDSSRPVPPEFEWGGFAEDALAVVEGLGLVRPFGLGHSQGGSAFLLAEQVSPGTFAGLYLYEPVAWPEPFSMDDHPLVLGALRRRDAFASVDAAEQRLGSKPPLGEFDAAILRAYVEHGLAPTPEGDLTLKCRPEDEAQTYRMGTRHRAFDHLGEVSCPTTIVRGSATQSVPAELAARQAALLPDGRLREIEGLGHFGPQTHPASVAAGVIEALLGP
jgi:pimeloyl-ACP methyl ester carboxylesterase